MESKLTVKVGADIDGLKRELNKASGHLQSFNSGMSKIGASIAGIFAGIGVESALRFGFEISKLAGEATGVKEAFDRLPESIQLLDELKTATSGTVSELELMKRAVMASNFGISLKALPELLEFATVRAKQTGQSVDYLVDSIVTGIGRKSKLILDNLGISAVQLTEALGGASAASSSIEDVANAVGKIASQELEKMGRLSENASTKIDRLGASWDNLKVTLGSAANDTGILGGVVDYLSKTLDATSSDSVNGFIRYLNLLHGGLFNNYIQAEQTANQNKKLAEEQKKHDQVIREVDRAYKEFNGDIDAYSKAIQTHIYKTELLAEFTKRLTATEKEKGPVVENLSTLTAKLTALQEEQQFASESQIGTINKEIKLTEEKIKKLKELGTVQKNNAFKEAENFGISDKGLSGPIFKDVQFVTAEEQAGLKKLGIYMRDLASEVKITKVEIKGFGDEWVQMWANVGMAAMNAAPILNETFANMAIGFGEALGDMASGLGGTELIWASVLSAIGNMCTQLGQLAIGTGIAVLGIKKALQSLNPYAAIAGGIALIALGKIVSNKAKSIGASGGSGSSSSGSISQPDINRNNNFKNEIILGGEFKFQNGALQMALSNDNIRSRRTG